MAVLLLTTGVPGGHPHPCGFRFRFHPTAAPARMDAGGPVRHGQAPAGNPGQEGARAQGAAVVAGDVPDRRRLLLHAGLSAGHRRARGRAVVAGGHDRAGDRDPGGRAAGVPAGGGGEPARRGLDRHAGASAVVLEGQAVRSDPARLRGHRLPDHHHPVGGGRLHPPGGESTCAQSAARTAVGRHAGAGRPAGCSVPQGLPGGDRRSRRPGRRVPGTQRGRRGGGPVARRHRPARGHRLVQRPDRRTRQRGGHGRRVAAGLSQAGARPVRLRDRRGGHAARRGRGRATPRQSPQGVSAARRRCSPPPP